jgi:hypothetical protein
MSLKDELFESIKIKDKLERQITIAAIITEALEPVGITPIVVGGTAVEFYTVGQYATMDIDFVGVINEQMKMVLAELGFSKDGRYWRIPQTDVMIEFPSDVLVGDMDRVQPVEFGMRKAYFIGVEDLILNRVQEAKHWGYPESGEWARTLMVTHYDGIDWSYCHAKAHEYQCYEKFEEIQRFAKKIKRQMDEQR